MHLKKREMTGRMLHAPVTSAYIHIPFCVSKCKYCSFVSGSDLSKKKGYLLSLLKEIDYYYHGEPLKTLYIGGGTPSCLDADELKYIVKNFSFQNNPEITIEVNPNDIDYNYALELKNIGFNRVSIGAQSFNDDILKQIGRRHSSDEIVQSVKTFKDAGFRNVSLDFIYGLPNQSKQCFEDDIKKAVSIGVEHISLYGLKIDQGCYFYNNIPDNLPDDDVQADMYLSAHEYMKNNGYNHYEISNYAKSGYESKHNTNYWKCGEYYGFGLSSHGYLNGVRYSNTTVLEEYMNNPTIREFGKILTKHEMLEERIFLGLRLSEGIDVHSINEEFEIDFDKKYKNVLKKYINSGHILETNKGYKLSDNMQSNGFLVSNIILADFL